MSSFQETRSYLKGLHFIPFNQAMKELRVNITEVINDLNIIPLMKMTSRTIVRLLNSIVGLLIVWGIANIVCFAFSFVIILCAIFSFAIFDGVSQLGAYLLDIVMWYLELLSNTYVAALSLLSAICAGFWWYSAEHKKESKQESAVKI